MASSPYIPSPMKGNTLSDRLLGNAVLESPKSPAQEWGKVENWASQKGEHWRKRSSSGNIMFLSSIDLKAQNHKGHYL